MFNKLSKKDKILCIATMLWIAFIWIHSMIPQVESENESIAVLDIINSILPFAVSLHFVRKLAHFTEYFILGFLQTFNHRRSKSRLPVFIAHNSCGCFFVAFIDETIQLFVEGRSGQISDVWLDFSGAFLAIILTCVIIKLRHKS